MSVKILIGGNLPPAFATKVIDLINIFAVQYQGPFYC